MPIRALPASWFAVVGSLVAQSPEPKPGPPPATPSEPRSTAPRADDDAGLAPILAKARQAVTDTGADGAKLLATPEFAPLHELTPFRQLVREHAPVGEVKLTLADEPGRPLTVRGQVTDRQGEPIANALIYAYHTSAKGWYADRAPHFSGNSGDTRHARLFAYVHTDADGRFVLQTIRPGGYPRSTLPEHIHLHIDTNGRPVLVTELLFDDDPRLTSEARDRATRNRFVIQKVERAADGSSTTRPVLAVDPKG